VVGVHQWFKGGSEGKVFRVLKYCAIKT